MKLILCQVWLPVLVKMRLLKKLGGVDFYEKVEETPDAHLAQSWPGNQALLHSLSEHLYQWRVVITPP
jgi:hypothetical protein